MNHAPRKTSTSLSDRPAVLVTGGAGYIGSHTCVELIRAGHSVVVLDNFCNSQQEALKRVGTITGVAPAVQAAPAHAGAARLQATHPSIKSEFRLGVSPVGSDRPASSC